MATIQDLGKVAYLNKGVYNSETTYEINDVVSFNGSSYVSKTNENRGNLPTNTIYWSIVASKGDKGETGKPFVIEKTYMTIEAMVADYDNMNINDYVMISGNIEEEQNATLWTKTANEVSPYKWEYLADFSGASGITGATPNIIIGNVTEGNQPAVTRRAGSSNENPILDFILKTGPKGDIGDTGNGISSIEKTGTSGLVDTYTITYTDGTTSTFQVTNGEDAEITPEEFEELQNEVNELKDENQRLKATLLTTTGTGENITLNKTAEMEFVVPPLPEGNTKQNTTEGIQRIDTNETINETIENGVTYSLKNGVFKFNGTATGAFYVTLTNKVNLESGDYTFAPADESGSYTGTMGKYGYTNTDVLEGGQTKAVTVRTLNENYSDVVLRFFIANGCVFNNYQFKINLVKGTYTSSTIPAWEPYTNGASPNPSYPQEVQVVKGDVEVKVENKNIANIDYFQESYTIGTNGLPIFSVGQNRVTNTVPINVKAFNNVVVSFENNTSNTINFIYSLLDAQNNLISRVAGNSSGLSINTSTAEYLYICFYDNVTLQSITEVQVEPNTTQSPYTPHKEQKLPLTLGDIELCKIGDYKDYPFKNLTNGKWYWHKEIGKAVLNGTENWILQGYNLSVQRIDLGQKTTVSNILSNYFIKKNTWNEQKVGMWLDANLIITTQDAIDGTETVNNFKTWLTTHNVILYYVLEEPIDTEITDTTLINQLEAIYNAISYYEQTNISGTSSGINPLFDVEAYQNTKLLLEDIINSN